MNLLGEKENEAGLSDIRDPFRRDCVEEIRFRIAKALFAPYEIRYTAIVEFVNGPTKGEQSFTADDFPSLVKKVDEFTNSLKP